MLEGKIALVMGASHGIGRRTAHTLGQEDASVVMNHNDSAVKIEEVVKEIEAAGGRAEATQCDVSDFENCGRMMADVVSRYDCLDILANNTGITRDNLFMKIPGEDSDAVISTNLKGVPNCIKHISRQTLKQKAERIINISSVSGVSGNAGQVNYCMAKTGVIGITKSAVREPASRGTTVSAVVPGFIVTEVADVLSGSVKAAAMEQIPMKYFGSTQDIAGVVVFLASDKAGHVTSQVSSVGGGMAMQDDLEYFPG